MVQLNRRETKNTVENSYLELNAVELEPRFHLETGGADGGNGGGAAELVDVDDVLFKVLLMDWWGWGWGRLLGLFLFLLGRGRILGLFAGLLLVLLFLLGVIFGLHGLFFHRFVGGGRWGLDFSFRHDVVVILSLIRTNFLGDRDEDTVTTTRY